MESIVANFFLQLHHGPGSVHLLHHGDPNFACSNNYSNICLASEYVCYDGGIDSAGFERRADIVYDDTG